MAGLRGSHATGATPPGSSGLRAKLAYPRPGQIRGHAPVGHAPGPLATPPAFSLFLNATWAAFRPGLALAWPFGLGDFSVSASSSVRRDEVMKTPSSKGVTED